MPRTVKSQRENRPIALLLGAGYSAYALIPSLLEAGYRVIATTRTDAKISALKNLGAEVLVFNDQFPRSLKQVITHCSVLLSSIPPDENGDPVIRHLNSIPDLHLAPHLNWAGYLSATSVYGHRDGKWVFEDELLKPRTRRGKLRLKAEIEWIESGLPVHIFRLAGIYGPKIENLERNPFERLRKGKARAVVKPGHTVNRIHVEDIARALLASIHTPDPLMIYNLADDHPAPPQDVIDFAAAIIDTPRPPRIDHNAADLSDMARSFYTETKSVSNLRAKTLLKWHPRYSNYKLGLMSIERQNFPNSVFLAGHLDVPKDKLASVKRALKTHIHLSVQEPDCQRFRIWQDDQTPTRFHVFEIFRSPLAFYRHQDRMKNSEWAHVSRHAIRHYETLGLDTNDTLGSANRKMPETDL